MDNNKIFVLWLTGLSASGKTTMAQAISQALKDEQINAHHLDGDEVRDSFTEKLGFSKEDRDKNIIRAIELAKRHQDEGKIVVASFISPYQEHRDWGRERLDNFIEVHIGAPLDVCETRDPKGMYKKARAGEIEMFTGISDPYEEPENPDIKLETHDRTIDECLEEVLGYLDEKGLIYNNKQ